MVHCVFHATYKYVLFQDIPCAILKRLQTKKCIAPGSKQRYTCTKCVLSMEDPSPPLSLQKVYLVKMTSSAWLLQFHGTSG